MCFRQGYVGSNWGIVESLISQPRERQILPEILNRFGPVRCPKFSEIRSVAVLLSGAQKLAEMVQADAVPWFPTATSPPLRDVNELARQVATFPKAQGFV